MPRAAAGASEQQGEVPTRADLGRFADHFGQAHEVFLITADTMRYDFGRLAPLEFAFIDGGHGLEHVTNDSRKAYEALAPGGWLVWHDFDSTVSWVRVREARGSASPRRWCMSRGRRWRSFVGASPRGRMGGGS